MHASGSGGTGEHGNVATTFRHGCGAALEFDLDIGLGLGRAREAGGGSSTVSSAVLLPFASLGGGRGGTALLAPRAEKEPRESTAGRARGLRRCRLSQRDS